MIDIQNSNMEQQWIKTKSYWYNCRIHYWIHITKRPTKEHADSYNLFSLSI